MDLGLIYNKPSISIFIDKPKKYGYQTTNQRPRLSNSDKPHIHLSNRQQT